MTGPRQKLDIVTVVFRGELPLLVLQARSLARFFDADAIGGIHVIVNDRAEADCVRAVEALRGEYGALAPLLRVVRPAELRDPTRRESAGQRAERWVVNNVRGRLRNLLPQRKRLASGWRGNSGWAMQQAFKLMSARVLSAPNVLILDAKNHFIGQAGAANFIDEMGRPRSRAVAQVPMQGRWIEASFGCLGYPSPPSNRPVPPSVTPVVLGRRRLLGAVAAMEQKIGPLDLFFAHKRGETTEFMLLFAEIDKGQGLWAQEFGDGLPVSLTAFSSSDDAYLGELLQAARDGRSPLMGVHRRRITSTAEDLRSALFGFWQDRGLIRDAAEARALFNV
ncbi:hypothetical protein JT55_08215 [Rhodovulum sp. NI22]|nr:hypothetical protein JT55_08215 [Rhodovulum sp. NI22]